jgi:hypothetical protein
MNKTRTIIIDGIEIQTSLTGVEIADLEQKNKELIQQIKTQKEVIDKVTNDLQQIIDNVKDRTIISLGQFIPKLEIIQDELNGSNDILKEVSE